MGGGGGEEEDWRGCEGLRISLMEVNEALHFASHACMHTYIHMYIQTPFSAEGGGGRIPVGHQQTLGCGGGKKQRYSHSLGSIGFSALFGAFFGGRTGLSMVAPATAAHAMRATRITLAAPTFNILTLTSHRTLSFPLSPVRPYPLARMLIQQPLPAPLAATTSGAPQPARDSLYDRGEGQEELTSGSSCC
jgi:hypothetical protein